MKEDVAVWLRRYFETHGKSAADQVRLDADLAGYSRFELKEARLICRVKSESVTFWSLPEDSR